jgi:AraC-like DNA-binding protein
VAIYYLDPLTQDYSALESQMPVAIPGIRYGHPQEDELIQRLVHVRDAGLPPNQAYDYLRDLIVHPSLRGVIFKVFDERVVEVVHRIRETVRESLSVSDFALEVNLSASWLEKQFKEQIGIPITKYRLRYRVFVSVIHLAAGMSVTDAALAAGFSSTSHFSKNFSAINGIPPSATFLRPPFLQVMVADNVLEARS